jgi:hypothetical protein
VLTLEMDGEAFAALDALRRRYYAPERNLVPVHITLFYRLPGERVCEIGALLNRVAGSQRLIEILPGVVRATESGVGVFFESPRLASLRAELADEWEPWLEDVDRMRFQPHVTIQTTLGEAEARRTRQAIVATARPPRIRGVGLHLWRYRDGPWESERLFRFRG